jgi:DNA-binding response OmpR family regulator
VLTGSGSPEMKTEAMERGVDAFLEKPRPLPELAALAATLLGRTA